MLVETPPPLATEAFVDAALAVARLEEIYERNTQFLRDRVEAYVNGEAITRRGRAEYPFGRVTRAGCVAPCLGLRRGARGARDQRHAAGSVPRLSHRADRAVDPEPRRSRRD